MHAECRILLVADSELRIADLRQALGEELHVAEPLSGTEPEVFRLALDERLVLDELGLGLEGRWDLALIAMAGRGAEELLARSHALHEHCATLIAIVDEAAAVPAWKRRSRLDRLLTRPFTEGAFLALVESQLLLAMRQVPASIPDEAYLGFLGDLIEHACGVIRPVIGAEQPGGWSYPAVAAAFGFTIDERHLLERLRELGLLKRRVAHRLRRCPACAGQQLVLGEACPSCESIDYAYEAAPSSDGRPSRRLRCKACGAEADRALLLARCLDCEQACPPERTKEVLVHAYELTPQAEEAVASGRIAGYGLASALRNRLANLHSRSFFLAELANETSRWRTYGTPCSLLMIRLPGLEDLRTRDPERFARSADEAWRAVTAVLRKLDVACVWCEDTLAVLLPGSPIDGARLVARRLEQQLAALTGAQVAALSVGEGGADAMLRDALTLVGIAIDSPDEGFIVIEDADEAEAILDLKI
jgi:GGDEF domain-containing protein